MLICWRRLSSFYRSPHSVHSTRAHESPKGHSQVEAMHSTIRKSFLLNCKNCCHRLPPHIATVLVVQLKWVTNTLGYPRESCMCTNSKDFDHNPCSRGNQTLQSKIRRGNEQHEHNSRAGLHTYSYKHSPRLMWQRFCNSSQQGTVEAGQTLM